MYPTRTPESYRRKTIAAGSGGAQAPAEQQARRVGRHLDPRAHFAELARRLEHRDAVSRVRERVGCCEAADACADDDDVQAERGAPAAVEGRDLLEGDVCDWFCGRVWVVLHGRSGEGKDVERGGDGVRIRFWPF